MEDIGTFVDLCDKLMNAGIISPKQYGKAKLTQKELPFKIKINLHDFLFQNIYTLPLPSKPHINSFTKYFGGNNIEISLLFKNFRCMQSI